MEIKKVLVIGAGQMGGGIAQVFAQEGYEVLLNDAYTEAISKRIEFIEGLLTKSVTKGKINEEDKKNTLANLIPCKDLKEAADVDLVVEAIVENVEVKASVIEELNDILRDDVIFATNTSSLPITELASNYKRPENYIGMHFFNPVPVMSLVEIIRGLATSDETYQAIHDLTLKINKFPAMVSDVPGFVSNRVLQVMINEAISCVEHGVATVESIDEVMKRGMNHPMGPLELADFIGLDTVLSILEVMYEGYGNPKYAPSPLLRSYVKAGWLGRKSGKGFYEYNK
ncbi:MAG: 3-hydroxybutyryl-CoA dehydrogenase [Tissierellia bacterium]|nr:3-hydroxybutyryl-CoA dehydrogenase [Tissierellia bacterium]